MTTSDVHCLQFTIPHILVRAIKIFAEQNNSTLTKIVNEAIVIGFEQFEKHTFTENTSQLIQSLLLDVPGWPSYNKRGVLESFNGWNGWDNVMVTTTPQQAVRFRMAAKEYQNQISYDGFGSMIITYGFTLIQKDIV